MEVDQAYRLICRAIDDGRAAGGYLVSGDVEGNCEELVSLVLAKLFPDELPQVEAGAHPDVVRLAPSGKSRTIKVERTDSDPSPGMRDAIIEKNTAPLSLKYSRKHLLANETVDIIPHHP